MTYQIPGATQRLIELDDVTLSVYEAEPAGGAESGDGGVRPAVVFSHGFPDLAYGWRDQLPAVAAAGFRAIAPDQRGYGGSSRPEAITDYDIFHLTGDLVGLLDRLDIERAVFVGHDWGGFVVWQMPLLHPDRVAGVVGLNTPFVARLPVRPTEVFRMLGGEGN
jgi:non-specific protein-tyrosine kinase